MAELKRNFSQAKMNKDLDERLVPQGQYREATNIQVATSDSSDVGALQTLLGNEKHSAMASIATGVYNIPDTATVVGAVAAANIDKAYYLISAGDRNDNNNLLDTQKDYILEYDTIYKTIKYVFVDIFSVKTTVQASVSSSNTFFIDLGAGGGSVNTTGIRVGMSIISDAQNYGQISEVTVSAINYVDGKWQITVENPNATGVSFTAADDVSFKSKRVLNYSKNRVITGINILDNFLFWTDNFSEPKKINIKRCIKGTGGTTALNTVVTDTFIGDTDNFQTRLVVNSTDIATDLNVATNMAGTQPVFIEEDHITVIRKAPTQPLELEMSRTLFARLDINGNSHTLGDLFEFNFFSTQGSQPVEVGTVLTLSDFTAPVDFRSGDIITFTPEGGSTAGVTSEGYTVRAEVVTSPVTNPGNADINGFQIQILSLALSGVPNEPTNWIVKLEEPEPLFQFKFPRFSYRYKYQDGEYSTFAPFTQVAFLPDHFSYDPVKGYNFGMINQIRGLKVKGYYYQENCMPEDVVEIDILYKETNDPTVYTVKTLRPSDGSPIWPLPADVTTGSRGVFEVTTPVVHAVVESLQLLRTSDAVPRKALAQEVAANRVVYGNYVQNYDILGDPSPTVTVISNELNDKYAVPSMKSMRTYQVGVVFSDEYGRETPVLTSKNSSVTIPKSSSTKQNRLSTQFDFNNSNIHIPDWAKYYSFYVKETSEEYYTMVMDRWYNAADGNIWLSFASSERNKIDEETFITLKNKHGVDAAVTEPVRYKVLAISNEAPDYIKTERKSLGVTNTINTGQFNSPSGGTTLVDADHVVINDGVITAVYGDAIDRLDEIDTLKLKFYGQNNTASSEYEVTKVSTVDAGIRFNLKEPISEDANFVVFTATGSLDSDGISIELIQEEVENKPEFDGRFFVKIYKDSQLVDNVILTTGGSDLDTIDNSWKLGYLNNNGYVNAGTRKRDHPDFGNSLDGYGWECPINPKYIHHPQYLSNGFFNSSHRHPTEYTYSGTTEYYWNNSANFTGATSSETLTSFLAMSPTPGYGSNAPAGITPLESPSGILHYQYYGPVAALNGKRANGSDYQPKGFWGWAAEQRVFFIDACTAYHWTGRRGSETVNQFGSFPIAAPQNQYDFFSFSGYLSHPTTGEILSPSPLNTHFGTYRGWMPGTGGTPSTTDAARYERFAHEYYVVRETGSNYDCFMGTQNDSDGLFTNFVTGDAIQLDTSEPPFLTPNATPGVSAGDLEQTLGQLINGVRYSGNQRQMRGQPSRGIWANPDNPEESIMDISWTGIGYGTSQINGQTYNAQGEAENYTIDPTQSGVNAGDVFQNGVPCRLQDLAYENNLSTGWTPGSSNANALEFITQLTAEGTKFKFARDPDETIYTVLDFALVDNYGYAATEDTEWTGYPIDEEYIGSEIAALWTNDGPWENTNGVIAGNERAAEGCWGIRNYRTRWDIGQYQGDNMRQRWSIRVTPAIGSGPSGYNPTKGTNPQVTPTASDPNHRLALAHDLTDRARPHDTIHIMTSSEIEDSPTLEGISTFNPGIWETEPKENVDLDIYYQASPLIPLNLNKKTNEELIPIGSKFKLFSGTGSATDPQGQSQTNHTVASWGNRKFDYLNSDGTTGVPANAFLYGNLTSAFEAPLSIKFTKYDHYDIELLPENSTNGQFTPGTSIGLHGPDEFFDQFQPRFQRHILNWHNCYAFGNGVESDRIRDDFNAPQFDNGVKASTVTAEPRIREERREYGMIYSGIYNSINGLNNTNQFIIADNITKEINPTHGSVQALESRNTRLIMFCEDKILKAVTNRDALYNADGKPQLVASNAVIGDITPYEGNYGVAVNPESIAKTPYRIYFTDAVRGEILSLSNEGVRSISNLGMRDYFADLFRDGAEKVIGSYDARKKEYNVTICKKPLSNYTQISSNKTTVSFSELGNGWTSFKSYTPDYGLSLNNDYFTFYNGHIWKHHSETSYTYSGFKTGDLTAQLENTSGLFVGMLMSGKGIIEGSIISSISGNIVTLTSGNSTSTCFTDPHISGTPTVSLTFTVPRNNFYNAQYTSDVTLVFNDMPEVVKSFTAINYEGTAARVDEWDFKSAQLLNNNYSSTANGAADGLEVASNISDSEYYNIGENKRGWYIDSFVTNLQECDDIFFINKEDKYFGYPVGTSTILSNLDEKEFSVQGLAQATGIAHADTTFTLPLTITVQNNISTTYEGNDNEGGAWDSTAD